MTNHWSFRRFTVAKSGSFGHAASVMACITDIFVMCSLYNIIDKIIIIKNINRENV